MSDFKPMLATDYDPAKLKFPVYASPKLDGIRGVARDGKLLSRSLKLIPNKHVQAIVSSSQFDGLDGELIYGSPTAPNCMQQCTSFFMAQDKVDDFEFHVFDHLIKLDIPYDSRLLVLKNQVAKLHADGHTWVKLVEQRMITNEFELAAYEAEAVDQGYEGLILRGPQGRYKFGRSTVNEGILLKVKRFVDSEARIIGFEEQMKNNNEKQTNELGRSKRSTHKAGLMGKNTLGALIVKDMTTEQVFNIGTGLNDALRAEIWADRTAYLSRIAKYKYFPVGVKDLPRHPVFIGFRDPRDMS